MDASTLASFLKSLLPTRLERRAGCLLWPEGDEVPGDESVQARLAQLTASFQVATSRDPAADARQSYMRAFNRRFIRNELEWRGLTNVSDDHLPFYAELWADLLRARLPRLVDDTVTVEVIGADAVDDEPLEVAVTFWTELEEHLGEEQRT